MKMDSQNDSQSVPEAIEMEVRQSPEVRGEPASFESTILEDGFAADRAVNGNRLLSHFRSVAVSFRTLFGWPRTVDLLGDKVVTRSFMLLALVTLLAASTHMTISQSVFVLPTSGSCTVDKIVLACHQLPNPLSDLVRSSASEELEAVSALYGECTIPNGEPTKLPVYSVPCINTMVYPTATTENQPPDIQPRAIVLNERNAPLEGKTVKMSLVSGGTSTDVTSAVSDKYGLVTFSTISFVGSSLAAGDYELWFVHTPEPGCTPEGTSPIRSGELDHYQVSSYSVSASSQAYKVGTVRLTAQTSRLAVSISASGVPSSFTIGTSFDVTISISYLQGEALPVASLLENVYVVPVLEENEGGVRFDPSTLVQLTNTAGTVTMTMNPRSSNSTTGSVTMRWITDIPGLATSSSTIEFSNPAQSVQASYGGSVMEYEVGADKGIIYAGDGLTPLVTVMDSDGGGISGLTVYGWMTLGFPWVYTEYYHFVSQTTDSNGIARMDFTVNDIMPGYYRIVFSARGTKSDEHSLSVRNFQYLDVEHLLWSLGAGRLYQILAFFYFLLLPLLLWLNWPSIPLNMPAFLWPLRCCYLLVFPWVAYFIVYQFAILFANDFYYANFFGEDEMNRSSYQFTQSKAWRSDTSYRGITSLIVWSLTAITLIVILFVTPILKWTRNSRTLRHKRACLQYVEANLLVRPISKSTLTSKCRLRLRSTDGPFSFPGRLLIAVATSAWFSLITLVMVEICAQYLHFYILDSVDLFEKFKNQRMKDEDPYRSPHQYQCGFLGSMLTFSVVFDYLEKEVLGQTVTQYIKDYFGLVVDISLAIAFVVQVLSFLHMLIMYKHKYMRLRAGKAVLPQYGYVHTSMARLIGIQAISAQVGFLVIAFIIFIVLVIIIIVAVVIYLLFGSDVWAWLAEVITKVVSALVGSTVVWTIVAQFGVNLVCWDRRRHEISHWRFFALFDYISVVTTFITGWVYLVIRIIFQIVFVVVTFWRVDITYVDEEFGYFDLGYDAYMGMLYQHYYRDNPILVTFTSHLTGISHKKSGVVSRFLMGSYSGQASVPISSSQRARNRWLLAYTLIRNPLLQRFRARPPISEEKMRTLMREEGKESNGDIFNASVYVRRSKSCPCSGPKWRSARLYVWQRYLYIFSEGSKDFVCHLPTSFRSIEIIQQGSLRSCLYSGVFNDDRSLGAVLNIRGRYWREVVYVGDQAKTRALCDAISAPLR